LHSEVLLILLILELLASLKGEHLVHIDFFNAFGDVE
jgi:hypothetical protein